MSIDPADYWMTPDEERRSEDKLTTDNNNPDKSPRLQFKLTRRVAAPQTTNAHEKQNE